MSFTRLIVKNLPPSTTESKLKDLFSSKGVVTDVQLKRFDDGKFRQFAFVGFQSSEQADTAKAYFDKTFFGSSRIIVEPCYALNDPNRPKTWSKRTQKKLKALNKLVQKRESKEDDDETKVKRKRKEVEILEKCKEDPAFLEFLEVHKKDGAKWGNDTVLDTLEKLAANDVVPSKKSKKSAAWQEEVIEKEDEADVEKPETTEIQSQPPAKSKKTIKEKILPENEFLTLKLRNLSQKTKKKDIKAFFHPLKPKSIRIPPSIRGIAYVGFVEEEDYKKALNKHKSILLGNQVILTKYESRDAVREVTRQKSTRWEAQTQDLTKQSETIEESGRIFVRNLAYTATEDDLRQLFEVYGPVTEVHLPVDRITRKIKGFAFVSFLLPEQAATAFSNLNGTLFQGRMLHLLQSKSKSELTIDDMTGSSSYKKEKELKIKKAAGSSHNWNALFLGQNAVSAVVAEKYGVSREQLLLDNSDEKDNRSSSVAVRMALAETEIVSETKNFLQSNGVCLEAFDYSNTKPERSTTVILVKNLEAYTTTEELVEIFQKHGELGRVVLPPSGISAIVEFMVPAEARAAFKKLAYSKFKSMPLYLEWAPVGIFVIGTDGVKRDFVAKPSEVEDVVTTKQESTEEVVSSSPAAVKDIVLPNYKDEEPFDENMVPEPDTTLFVKNLNFSTVDEDLKKHFSVVGRVYAVTVARRKDPKFPGQLLSQGFGFVQYYKSKDAAKALETLNQSMLNNHLVELKLSTRTLHSGETGETKSQERKGTKILVRNVPFQASEEEITNLFMVFGKLKAVRMPQKNMGESQHRGFAFVEFLIEAHAKAAFETLSKSTHIYGRRLALEWAQADESVEELREKVAKRYNLQRAADTSSTKKQMRRYFESEGPKASKGGAESEDDD